MNASQPKKLLIISYLFPPSGGVAVQRMLSLAKYLPGQGFEVHVLSAPNAATPVVDRSLLQQIPPSVHGHHARTLEPPFAFRQKVWARLSSRTTGNPAAARSSSRGWKSLVTRAVRRIFCPEPEVMWTPFAIRKARRLIRRYGIDTVLVTAPPFSAFLVGIRLKREFPRLKLITDFRDSWLVYYAATYDLLKDPYTRKRAEEIERDAVTLSDSVVSVTPSIVEELRSRYPGEPGHKFVCIPNGYDPELFAGIPRRAEKQPAGKIVVAYVGTVATASSPRFFLDALEDMPEPVRSAFELRFIGRVIPSEQDFLESRRVSIKRLGFLSQAEALRELAAADYALVVMTDAASLTGKIFEYLAAGKPILAVAPLHGEVARLLSETGGGWCAGPQDHLGLKQMIQQAYDAAQHAGRSAAPNLDAIRRYERPRLAAEYARVLEGRRVQIEVEVMQ